MLDIATLLGAYEQTTRLIRLTTSVEANVMLAECVRAEEAMCQPFILTISALSQDAGVSLRSLLGKPALVELLTAGDCAERPFHGYVTQAEACGSNGGLARYKLTLQPWTAFASLGRDSRVFHDMTVIDIVDAVFANYHVGGKLAPAWRWEIADKSIYPLRSLTTQYQESNMAFAERLLSEEGLFYFFEHEADSASPGLGLHTMVIADHNDAFQPNKQAVVRYTQPGAVMKEDSIDRWRSEFKLQTNAIELQSWDYRTRDSRPVAASGAHDAAPVLVSRDAPGAYAYPSRAQGERMAANHMQSLDAARRVFIAAGTVRTFSPGTTFMLSGHAIHDRADCDDERTFTITRTVHLMHNNLSADLRACVTERIGVAALAGLIESEQVDSIHRTRNFTGDRPLYRNRIDAIPSSVPFRASRTDAQGRLLYPRPTIHGQQSAVVVGPEGAVIHTDRDHRVKIQFHWQRDSGEGTSHSRLSHPAPAGHAGAPGNDKAGTWVRVAAPLAPIAGANWGSNAIPRVGQEVLVDFLEGDIDRPVVIGALYNGRGEANAQNNQVSQGAGAATGNAPAWFPGLAGAHAHPAVLSGLKSQAMQTSGSGTGGYSQLLFDDSPGKSRLALQRHATPHTGTAELNLGQLRHQSDNQLLTPVGYGAELKTEHSMALRAGQGMLIASDKRAPEAGGQLDSSEAIAQVSSCHALQETLATTAKKHNATLKDKDGAEESKPTLLPALAHMAQSIEAMEATNTGVTGRTSSGGQGDASAYAQPQLQLSSPAGIVAVTPASALFSAGDTSSITAGHDINFVAQGNHFHSVTAGISLFTYGKASNKDKPNQETGIMLHAATGKVSTQSQSGETRITADKTVTVASVTKAVKVGAKEHVLMTAQGAYLKLEGGNIMLHGPGKIEFKSTMKELAGPESNITSLPTLPHPGQVGNYLEINHHWPDLTPVAGGAYRAVFANGVVKEGTLDHKGHARLENVPPGSANIFFGEDPRPFTPPTIASAGRLTQVAVRDELQRHGYDTDPDDLEALLERLSGRNLG